MNAHGRDFALWSGALCGCARVYPRRAQNESQFQTASPELEQDDGRGTVPMESSRPSGARKCDQSHAVASTPQSDEASNSETGCDVGMLVVTAQFLV